MELVKIWGDIDEDEENMGCLMREAQRRFECGQMVAGGVSGCYCPRGTRPGLSRSLLFLGIHGFAPRLNLDPSDLPTSWEACVLLVRWLVRDVDIYSLENDNTYKNRNYEVR
jgi:hypothetical protein